MTTTGTLVLGGIFLVVCVGAVILVFEIASAWAIRREEARRTWHVAECADVAPVERETDELLSTVRERAALDAATRVIYESEMCDLLDEVMPDAKAIGERRAGR